MICCIFTSVLLSVVQVPNWYLTKRMPISRQQSLASFRLLQLRYTQKRRGAITKTGQSSNLPLLVLYCQVS